MSSNYFTCEGDPGTHVVRCEGSLPAGDTDTVTIQAYNQVNAPWVATNTAEVSVQGVPTVISSDTLTTRFLASLPGEEPGEDNGERVLVDHKGKELCLPRAALKGHERHGDEVISEEGCSNAKKGRNK